MKIIKKKYSINDVISINLRHVSEENGSLVFLENEDINFPIERIFTIKTNKPEIRGIHAHRECFQLLYCPLGKIEILCDDADNKKKFNLDNINSGIIIPPTIWATQNYISKEAILNVICSHKFMESDYIRNYEIYKKFRENINN